MKKKDFYALLIFGFLLIVYSFFSKKINFHDTAEFITTAKYFAGVRNMDLFSAHSLLYPLIISIFLKIWQSFAMIKLVNCLWLFGIGLLLLIWLKNKRAFILFAFSPLIWYVSIQTTPILPASFFFFLSFVLFKRTDIKRNEIYSGLLLGLSCAFYTPMILIGFLFILVYFWKKNLNDLFKYLIAVIVGFSPRMILDYYLFNMPFYSLIRYAGANLIVLLGLHSTTKSFNIVSNLSVLLIFVAISPLLFRLHKINYSKYREEIIFLILAGAVFLIRGAMLKYFLIITPIIILLLNVVLTDKEIKWHAIISLFLILFLTFNFFTDNQDISIQDDLGKIKSEFNESYIIAGALEAPLLSSNSWTNQPYLVWFQDFKASLENETTIRAYEFNFNSRIPLRDKLNIFASFDRFENKTYEDYILVTSKTSEEFKELENFELRKCYKKLCVYK